MAKLTNTQINNIVNEVYVQMVGKSDIEPIDISKLSDIGRATINDDRERFTNGLIGVLTRNWFTDTSYRSEYTDLFYEDYQRFGAIIQAITVEIPEAIENSAWKDYTSGVSTVGQYTVHLPKVDAVYYNKSTSWAIPITISWEQWDTAFRNDGELSGFVDYVFMVVDNALVAHMEQLNETNRNNFISEKLIYANSEDAKGVHVVDLVGLYASEKGLTTALTVEQAIVDREFLAFASARMGEYVTYFKRQTSLFNTAQKVRFTPTDRIVMQVLDKFEQNMRFIGYADTFHEEYIQLPTHQSVAWWQNGGDLSFNDVSSIHVSSPSGTTERSGIVGLLCDKWAIVHTIRSERVGSHNFDIENLTHYEYQHRDSYINNLTMNAIVFVLNDFTPA